MPTYPTVNFRGSHFTAQVAALEMVTTNSVISAPTGSVLGDSFDVACLFGSTLTRGDNFAYLQDLNGAEITTLPTGFYRFIHCPGPAGSDPFSWFVIKIQ